ncbi:hypothetical protein [Dyadobacter sp. 676]|uniref:RHS repeat-associated core domain-containing protein n=1 Tax=Dyadobacter sp. 676 TaxID=3088362 RepID=A0AAU8FSD3_9BACT
MTRLVKDGGITPQYVKSGKFFGRVSRVDEYGGYATYAYDDNNPAGNLWITKKWYNTNGNGLGKEYKFLVVNGRCISSTSKDFVTNDVLNYIYTYNAQGQLEEAKLSNGNAYKYSYKFYPATNSYQLDKLIIVFECNLIGEAAFKYNALANKYSIGNNYGNIEKYLPIFGKFNDLLVDATEEFQYSPPDVISTSKFTYTLDSDGLPTNIMTLHDTKENGVSKKVETENRIYKYSDNWQGI